MTSGGTYSLDPMSVSLAYPFITKRRASSGKNNIKKNMLSLKSLQEELELLKKTSKATQTVSNGKQSIETTLFTRGATPMLFVLTTLLTFAHKIPIVAKVTKLLSLWYGRTTRWQNLVSLSKFIVVINAIIGVYTVLKITGFSTDNILSGIAGMGTAYVEIFSSFLSRLFGWFHRLFDKYVLPKPPTDHYWKWWGPKENTWYTGGRNNMGKVTTQQLDQLDFLNHKLNIKINDNTGWSWLTWLWYGGIALTVIGVAYVGYNIYTDTTWLLKHPNGQPNLRVNTTTPQTDQNKTGPNPQIALGDNRTAIIPLVLG